MVPDILHHLQHLEHLGNINTLIVQMVENYPSLLHVKTEILDRIYYYVSSFPHLIAPRTLSAIKSLPKDDLELRGLASLFKQIPHCRPTPSVGRIPLPVFASSALVRDILVLEDPGQMPGQRRQMLDFIGSILFRTLSIRLARNCFWKPERYSFHILDLEGHDDHTVEGDSMGLALALALCSRVMGTPLPADITALAKINGNGSLGRVARLDEKLAIVAAERPFIKRAIIAKSHHSRAGFSGLKIIEVSSLEEALDIVFPQSIKLPEFCETIDIQTEINSLKRQFDSYMLDTCIENANQLIAYLERRGSEIPANKRIPALFICYWKKASCLCHKGQAKETSKHLKKALTIYSRHPGLIRPDDYFEARVSYCVVLKDLFQYHKALSLHSDIAHEMETNACLDHTRGTNLSTLSQLYLAMGKFKEAEQLQKQAISLINEDERSRNYGYLAQIYSRSCQFRKSGRALALAYSLLKKSPSQGRAKKTAYLDWYKAEYLYIMGINRPKRQRQIFGRLYQLSSKYQEVDWWVPALIQKFAGLSLLRQNRAIDGLKCLGLATGFFDSQFAPVLRVLGASVKAQRALYFFNTTEIKKAKQDMRGILADLSLQKDIRDYFKKELNIISELLKKKKCPDRYFKKGMDALKNIIGKIPY